MFSYGSGVATTLFSLKIKNLIKEHKVIDKSFIEKALL